jgi:hypothetical protein
MADEVGQALKHLFQRSRWQQDDHLVFANPSSGAPLDKSALRRRYRKALRAAGIDGFGFTNMPMSSLCRCGVGTLRGLG